MKGYFNFDLTASDNVHESKVPVKIVIISVDDKIYLQFDNPLSEVQNYTGNIIEIFDSVFPEWKFNIDYIDNGQTEVINGKNSLLREEKTEMECHFLNRENFEPVKQSTVAS